jgi:hypothetical protein
VQNERHADKPWQGTNGGGTGTTDDRMGSLSGLATSWVLAKDPLSLEKEITLSLRASALAKKAHDEVVRHEDVVSHCFDRVPVSGPPTRLRILPDLCGLLLFNLNTSSSDQTHFYAWSGTLTTTHWFRDSEDNCWQPEGHTSSTVDLARIRFSGTNDTTTVPLADVLDNVKAELEDLPGHVMLAQSSPVLRTLSHDGMQTVLGWLQTVPTTEQPLYKVSHGPFTLLRLGSASFSAMFANDVDVGNRLETMHASTVGPPAMHTLRLRLEAQRVVHTASFQQREENDPSKPPSVFLFESNAMLHQADSHVFRCPHIKLDDGTVVRADGSRSTLLRRELGLEPQDTDAERLLLADDQWHHDFATKDDRNKLSNNPASRNRSDPDFNNPLDMRVKSLYEALLNENYQAAIAVAGSVRE